MIDKLTKHPQGSIKELFTVSLPLMISALASLLMIFVDRCFLARYSLDALNASVNSGTLAWAFMGGFGMLTVMSSIFVAQYNGSKQLDKIGKSVWQMIWISVFSTLFFIPLAYMSYLIFKTPKYANYQIDYFKYLMFFSPFYPLYTALSGFFIGRGKAKILIYVAIFANLINVLFDYILIFGIKGFIPSYGIKGAAIATSLGTVFQAIILGYLFFSKENIKTYKTNDYKLDFSLLKKSFKVGFPPAIFFTLEMIGWAIFYIMMTKISEMHITVSSICQSIVILLSFFFDGLHRGISALAGNFIGAKKTELINKLVKASIKLLVIFTIIVSMFLIIDSKIVIDFLIPKNIEGKIAALQKSSNIAFYSTLKICFYYVFAYLFFEGIRWIFAGLLTAAGDTLFLLIAGSLSVWIFLLLPIYFIVVRFSLSVEIAWLFAASYAFILSIIYFIRFKNGKWKSIKLLEEKTPIEDEVIESIQKNENDLS
ncbi:MAG: Multidrug resistance protein MdtK [Candidatus Anoxychlamydiales bacterium]|nr:Multidrug resistance protein MdtK [Candidatus Anoxychlamydiales bacterium]